MATPAPRRLFDRQHASVSTHALAPPIAAAVEKSAARHGLEHPLATVSAAIQVDSRERKSGLAKLFGKPRPVRCTALLTPERLWLAIDDGRGLHALALQLDTLEVIDYESTFAATRIDDHGLDLTGFQPGSSERTTYFLGLDTSAESDGFRAAVRAAVTGRR